MKVGLKQFRREVLGRETIGNVDLILDLNHHNQHPDFDAVIETAKAESGSFRSVYGVSKIDSAASRMLQLADVVAYSRKWIVNEHINAAGLHDRYGVRIL